MENKTVLSPKEKQDIIDMLLGKGAFKDISRRDATNKVSDMFDLTKGYNEEKLMDFFASIKEINNDLVSDYRNANTKVVVKDIYPEEVLLSKEEKEARKTAFENDEKVFNLLLDSASTLLNQHAKFINKEDYGEWQRSIVSWVLFVVGANEPDLRQKRELNFGKSVVNPANALRALKENNKDKAIDIISKCMVESNGQLSSNYNDSLPVALRIIAQFSGNKGLEAMKSTPTYQNLDPFCQRRFESMANKLLEEKNISR